MVLHQSQILWYSFQYFLSPTDKCFKEYYSFPVSLFSLKISIYLVYIEVYIIYIHAYVYTYIYRHTLYIIYMDVCVYTYIDTYTSMHIHSKRERESAF